MMTKRFLSVSMMILVLGLTVTLVTAETVQPAGGGIVVGDAVEISTFAMEGLAEENIATMKFRASEGFPVGIIEEETGKLYVCVYRNPAPASGLQSANEKLAPYLGQKVAAQGLVFHEGDVNLIRLSIVTEY